MSIYDPQSGQAVPVGEQADEAAPDTDPIDGGSAPLSGLLAGHDAARKRAYYLYAAGALVVSFAPDVIVAGLLTGHQADVLTASAALASSILLKIGVAFGFVAASNTGR